MRGADVYPHDTLTGGCFVTGDYDPGHGIVDLEVYVDALPPFGRLVVSGTAVRDMVTVLGWKLEEGDVYVDLANCQAKLEATLEENARMRKAIASIIDITKMARIDDSWLVAS